MTEGDWLTDRFEENRGRLTAIAVRMLGSRSEADDAVQEAWLRLSRSDASAIENLGGWLTTVVGRVCLDMLRSRKSRREEPLELGASEPSEIHPEQEVMLAEGIGLALVVVLETLTPTERVAFVLHDMFGMPFDEIAPIIGRSTTAARQLASRARRRVQGASRARRSDFAGQRPIVEAFLAASRGGDFTALIALLDPEVVFRSDAAAVQVGADLEVVGAEAVAATFGGRARTARVALLDGVAGLVWAPGGKPRVVFEFTVVRGKIVAIDAVADPARLEAMEVVFPQ